MRSVPRLAMIFVLAAAVSACGSGSSSSSVLQDNLAAQQQALDALRGRVTQLVDQVQTVQSTDPMTGLSQLADRVDALTGRLDTVEQDLADQASGRKDEATSASARIDEVASTVDRLRTAIQDLVAQLTQVQNDLDQLRAAVQNGGAPGG